MEPRARDLWVGLFLLVGCAAIAFLSVSVGGATYRGPGGLELFVTFDQVGGLKPRAPVVIGGVKVGQVKSILLDEDLRARVGLDVDGKLRLPTDTSASILTAGVLGDQYVELTPGGAEESLGPGDEIEFKQDAFVLERLIGRLIQNLGASTTRTRRRMRMKRALPIAAAALLGARLPDAAAGPRRLRGPRSLRDPEPPVLRVQRRPRPHRLRAPRAALALHHAAHPAHRPRQRVPQHALPGARRELPRPGALRLRRQRDAALRRQLDARRGRPLGRLDAPLRDARSTTRTPGRCSRPGASPPGPSG